MYMYVHVHLYACTCIFLSFCPSVLYCTCASKYKCTCTCVTVYATYCIIQSLISCMKMCGVGRIQEQLTTMLPLMVIHAYEHYLVVHTVCVHMCIYMYMYILLTGMGVDVHVNFKSVRPTSNTTCIHTKYTCTLYTLCNYKCPCSCTCIYMYVFMYTYTTVLVISFTCSSYNEGT